MASVFVSYAAKADVGVRDRLVADLRAAGVDVWTAPSSIRPGELFPAAIDRGLEESDYLLVLLSAASLASRWVQIEVSAGMARAVDGKITVLPLLVSHVAVPSLLSTFQQIDLTDYDRGLSMLGDAIGVPLHPGSEAALAEPGSPTRRSAPGAPDAFVATVRDDLERGAQRFRYLVQPAPPLPGSVVDSIVEVALLRIGVGVWPARSLTTGQILAETERELRTNPHGVVGMLAVSAAEETTLTPYQLLDASSPNAVLLSWNESDGSDAIGASIDIVVRYLAGDAPTAR